MHSFVALIYCFLSVIFAHAYVGSFMRFMGDDFCHASGARLYGVIPAVIVRYQTWSGRFAAAFLDYAFSLLGPDGAPYSPMIVLTLWMAAITFLLYECEFARQRSIRLAVAVLLSTLILSTTLITAPAIGQSLYWEAGMHSVIPPLVLGTVYAGLLFFYQRQAVGQGYRVLGMVLAFCLTFLASGFSETYSVFQTSTLTIAFLIGLITREKTFKRNVLPFLVVGLLGSLIATTTMIIAPGNQIRQADYPIPDLFSSTRVAVTSFIIVTGRALFVKIPFNSLAILQRSITWLSLLFLPAFVGSGWLLPGHQIQPYSKQTLIRILLLLPILTTILLIVCFIPAAYGMSLGMPRRTQVIYIYILTCALAIWGYAFGQLMRHRKGTNRSERNTVINKVMQGALVVLFGLNAVCSAYQVLETQPVYRAYAQAWDELDQFIKMSKAQGKTLVAVPPLPNPIGLEDLTTDPNHWVNKCLSRYYGVTVVASSDPESK